MGIFSKTKSEKLPKARTKLTKKALADASERYKVGKKLDDANQASIDKDTGERKQSAYSDASTLVDTVRPADQTDMLHSLGYKNDSAESLPDRTRVRFILPEEERLDPRVVAAHERMLAKLSPDLWAYIITFLDAEDAASLAISSKNLLRLVGLDPWRNLNDPENVDQKINYLLQFDHKLPNHLFCFQCAQYHYRLQPGMERLKINHVTNPLFVCPNVHNSVLPRTRLVHGRTLPYAFVQLALRGKSHGSTHGIDADSLSRRWACKDSDWTHRTRYHIYQGHLLMRCVSQVISAPGLTPTAERMLLYSREEFEPYFSVCAHWRDGVLTEMCKCALSHIPRPKESITSQIGQGRGPTALSWSAARKPNYLSGGCDECRPMRRCPECPTEYQIETKMVEDKDRSFKHALVVTRWSDLGDGSSPYRSAEWASCNGKAEFDSYNATGRRAISGVFESAVSNVTPGQRMLSLNPKRTKLGEAGNNWY